MQLTSGGVVYSYCLIAGLYDAGDVSTTPLGFTRGLKSNGLWHEKYGLYGDSGGYVIYLDGHVKWFDGKRPAKFLKWNKQEYTTDIREAVPNTTFIDAGYNLKRNITDSDGALLILYHNGTGGAE